MRVSIRYGQFNCPMRFSFKHASASRAKTQNVVVAITDENGCVGYGEGCPRDYVTGETLAGAISFLGKHGQDAANATSSLESFQEWMSSNEQLIDNNPAAFCALELAVLDLLGKRENINLETLLGLPQLLEPASYTAVIGDSSPSKMFVIALAYRLFGFSDFKVKLGGDLQRDNKRLSTLPAAAWVRFDANNLWVDSDSCISYCKQFERRYWAIEEPVDPFDASAQKEISQALDTKIILDESCLSKRHMDLYQGYSDRFIANIRVSKNGGVMRSIELANHCMSNGFDVILGAHVGETSLLTRAALAVAQGMNNSPLAREGAYGRILLMNDVAKTSLRFGPGGVLRPSRYQLNRKNGLGIDVNPSLLELID